ncbi:MAG TPA: WYL domain-containing protein [Mycobacteriales bacterium]|nr:WYL domain-containing protein [Mycobacteriales bacterium]
MKADRLVAILLLLQRRDRVTAAQVAAELEVSERTARRDLEGLMLAGLPVYPERGRGGGWRLLGGARTDLSGLSAAEARALFLVAGPSAQTNPELNRALRKLVRALPEPFRDAAETAAGSVVHDPSGWGRTTGSYRPPHLDSLQEATSGGRQVRLGYRDRGGASSSRIVHPLGTALKGAVWYLLADTDAGLRTFRIGRVTSVEPTGEPVIRPPGFDLEAAWRDVVDRVDLLRSPAEITAAADADLLPVLRWIFGGRLTVADDEGARITITLRGESLEIVTVQLAGFGRRVEVLAPPEARERLARIGAELSSTYTDGLSLTP